MVEKFFLVREGKSLGLSWARIIYIFYSISPLHSDDVYGNDVIFWFDYYWSIVALQSCVRFCCTASEPATCAHTSLPQQPSDEHRARPPVLHCRLRQRSISHMLLPTGQTWPPNCVIWKREKWSRRELNWCCQLDPLGRRHREGISSASAFVCVFVYVYGLGGGAEALTKHGPIHQGATQQRLPVRDVPRWAETVLPPPPCCAQRLMWGMRVIPLNVLSHLCSHHVEPRCPNKATIWNWVILTLKSIFFFYYTILLKFKGPLKYSETKFQKSIGWPTSAKYQQQTRHASLSTHVKEQGDLLAHNLAPTALFLLSWNCVLAGPTGII